MADGFIIKRGSQGGTKQVDSIEVQGLTFGYGIPPDITENNGMTMSPNIPPNTVETNGQAYPQT